MSGEFTGTSRSYFVVLLDEDAEDYDLIGVTNAFSPDDLRASTQGTFEVTNADGTVYAQIEIAN